MDILECFIILLLCIVSYIFGQNNASQNNDSGVLTTKMKQYQQLRNKEQDHDEENSIPLMNSKETQNHIKDYQKENDKLLQEIRDFKNREKKMATEIQILKSKLQNQASSIPKTSNLFGDNDIAENELNDLIGEDDGAEEVDNDQLNAAIDQELERM